MPAKSSSAFLWTVVILINIYFIYSFPSRHFNMQRWNEPFGPILISHIVFGIIALLLGPFQFFPAVRKKYPQFHRWSGRVYLLAILLGGITALLLAIYHNILPRQNLIFGTGIIGLAAAWLVTSGMALWAVRKRNFVQHREWMVKSYVVTCGFTTYRIFAVTLNSYLGLDYDTEMSGIMAWACWAVPLLLTDAIIQGKKVRLSSGKHNVAKRTTQLHT